jgi:hypothetical protein
MELAAEHPLVGARPNRPMTHAIGGHTVDGASSTRFAALAFG